ncbi:hypothetical protein Ancab_008750 [Ancistrocladus abbreviatus]
MAWLLDQFGVLHDEKQPYPGAISTSLGRTCIHITWSDRGAISLEVAVLFPEVAFYRGVIHISYVTCADLPIYMAESPSVVYLRETCVLYKFSSLSHSSTDVIFSTSLSISYVKYNSKIPGIFSSNSSVMDDTVNALNGANQLIPVATRRYRKREKAEAEMQRCIYGFQIPYEMNRQVSETMYDQTVESWTSRCTNYEQLQFGPRRIPKTAEQWCVKR